MEKYLNVIKSSPLFSQTDDVSLLAMLGCLRPRTKHLARDAFALMAGEKPEHIGLLLTGRLHVFREDISGASALLTVISPGDIFAEALVCAGLAASPVSVIAVESSEVMWLSLSRVLGTCPSACPHHSALIERMISLLAQKNIMLQSRMELLEKKSTRERVMLYLSKYARGAAEKFAVPLNRAAMADYLGVDRSALSRELSRMESEGLISYRKNEFTINKDVLR